MPNGKPNPALTAHKVELALGRLESLAILPCVGAQLLSRLLEPQFSASAIADIVESEPSLTAGILRLIEREGVGMLDGRFSLRAALDRLPQEAVREAILLMKTPRVVEFERGPSVSRRDLLLHSLAVGCCSREISEIASGGVDSQWAYLAGLLHDLGKLAIQEIMPKGFSRIVEEAESSKSCSCVIEEKHLGADHTIFGKHLAQRWRLPDQITFAIWLHHGEAGAIGRAIPEARLAQIVQLADLTVRRHGIGRSGSCDSPEPSEEVARSLEIGPGQLEEIGRRLPELVAEKAKPLSLDMVDATGGYLDVLHTAASRFARDNKALSADNRRLQAASSHLDFTTELLMNVSRAAGVVETAENLAVRWQRFYQTGTVCLYLAPRYGSGRVEAVVVEKLGESKTVDVEVPAGTPSVPKAISGGFALLDAHEHLDWLFEQLDVDFDSNVTKLAPLLSAGRAVGAIAFELYYPAETELIEEKFKRSALVAGAVLSLTIEQARQQHLAEQLERVVSASGAAQVRPREAAEPMIRSEDLLTALAETASGAAHELNNPLSVISGRAQLLAEAESDQEKKKILKQIQYNAGEASEVIEDLMSFAEPPEPRAVATDMKQMLDEAIQLTGRKTETEHMNVQVRIAPEVGKVFVDSAQIVSAIANIIANAVESYSDELGPIKIEAEAM
ncbi:MAG: HDOD domain-containing protein, partial [Phycisphaerales bacterium]